MDKQLDILLGSLRPGDRTTGLNLRGYNPAPAAILPPPPLKKIEKEEKEEKK